MFIIHAWYGYNLAIYIIRDPESLSDIIKYRY